jgi:glycosyltransferase involved in cell wall biosynthesis
MKPTVRVAFVGRFSNASVNGVENSGFYLAQELVRHQVEVFFYSISNKTERFTDLYQIQHRLFAAPRFFFGLSKEFRFFLRTNPDRIDVYHLHSVFIPRHFFISYLLNSKKLPYVITPHGGYIRKALQRTLRTHRLIKMLYINFIERYITNHARAMIATTERESRDNRSFGYKGPMYVVPNLNPPFIPASTIEEPTSGETILFLGRYDVLHKGLLFLLDTFRHLSELLPDVQLVFHGNGKDKGLLERKVQREKIPRVIINDPVYGVDKLRVLQNCTLYCQPSAFESFGLSLVEAMLAGKPVVLTEECYLSSMLRENGLGLIIPVDAQVAAESIQKFLNNPEELVRQGKALQALALKEFDATKVAHDTLQVYRSVLNKKSYA